MSCEHFNAFILVDVCNLSMVRLRMATGTSIALRGRIHYLKWR